MKTRTSFIMLVIFICILCCACSNQRNLSFEDMNKSKDAAVTYSFIGKEVYMIDFATKAISVPNNMIVYLNMDTNKLIGLGIVD